MGFFCYMEGLSDFFRRAFLAGSWTEEHRALALYKIHPSVLVQTTWRALAVGIRHDVYCTVQYITNANELMAKIRAFDNRFLRVR